MANKAQIIPLDQFKGYNPLPPQIPSHYNGGNNTTGGGDGMKPDYVTHEELGHVENNLKHEIKESELETKSEINTLSGKIDNLSANIDTKFAIQKVWLIGTVVTVVSAGIGILSYIMSLMINH
ncbi:hypothetical protein IWT25_00163 [Secundilactobacillus pentosiphilus]|uniref:Uncharacterized protein n=1 Tax=Secundilactobacillus pentosiphilus TaxID=1714682 RepID=A0A1Z5IT07_9LACO|nr:hypothetical protein [Secundilactobacillus pentosiphilus]GAX04869.1 hypothetical protein IWT25_00163 [Secundilactobacillus pentosiphilus]